MPYIYYGLDPINMKKVITAATIMLLFTAASVTTTFAKSAQSLGSSDKYFDKWCNNNKPNAPLEKKVICDLMRRVNALEDLEAEKEQMIVYDYDGNELGVYAGEYSLIYTYVHYPNLDKLLPIDTRPYDNPGKLGHTASLYYLEPDCAGDPYVYSYMNYTNKIISHENEYYIVEDGQPHVNENTLSYRYHYTGECFNINYEEREVLPVKKVELSLPDPVALPLQYRYE